MPLHLQTPLMPSAAFSDRSGLQVSLKLENTQACGSFKIRGVGHACQIHHARGAKRFISSSGGNAGYAVAYAGRQLGVPVSVVVPETTTDEAKRLIRALNAEVTVHGNTWQEANALAQTMIKDGAVFIHPFDDPLLWEGHATIVDELRHQGEKPDVIICSVGGGGLLAGVCAGLARNNWHDVGILGLETQGADSFAQSIHAGKLVELPGITSIATSLGARQVSAHLMDLYRDYKLRNHVVSDADALSGCLDLLEAHRMLTEPACGASIAGLPHVEQHFPQARKVVVIVCGGIGVSVQQLQRWQQALTPNLPN